MGAKPVDWQSPNGWAVLKFDSSPAFEAWLDRHHADQPGLWVAFAKKGRGIQSVTFDEALETAMCFGWVDSKMHGVDEDYYVLRFQPRRPKSAWSARNKDLAERLTAEGRMRPPGLAQVDAAKADGRWDAN
jgi:uncharacterized protein YdeI (YjbR/CyaY-like superfamily)